MIVFAYVKIDISLLSTKKTNIIPFTMGDDPTILGTVAEIGNEVQPNIFRCLIKVLPEHEIAVTIAMKAEEDKLTGKPWIN